MTTAKRWNCSIEDPLAISRKDNSRGENITHAIQAPCVLKLVSAPEGREFSSFLVAEVGSELLRNRFSRQQGAVEIKCYDHVLPAGGHQEDYVQKMSTP